MSETAIEARQIVKRFGKVEALTGLSLTVPKGAVYALLGRNGAGKSTLIQLLLGLLEPTTGALRVLGGDPVKGGPALRQRIGYVPERLPLYEWMTVSETLRFAAAQYENWSLETEKAMQGKFRLPLDRRVRDLSRGQRALLSLVLALSHDPDLVLLDECTSGMDALARSEFDRSVIDALHESGRTVLFASHQIRELERLCDHVGILHNGKLLLEMPLDELKASVKRLRVGGEIRDLPGLVVLEQRQVGREWLATVQNYDPAALPSDLPVLEVSELTLEEIFVALLTFEEARP